MFFQTQPLDIKDLPADDRHIGGVRDVSTIEMIVLHDTASPANQSSEETRNFLSTSPNSNVSVHRYTDYDGTIWKILPDALIANQIGFSRMGNRTSLNKVALGIEMRRRAGDVGYPKAQLISVAQQCVEWYGLYGSLPILYHRSIDTKSKTDPRDFPRDEFDRIFFTLLGIALR